MSERKEHFPNRTRNRGLEHVSVLIRDSMQDAAASQGFATSLILTGWTEIAGPSIAEFTAPVRISYGRDGKGATLVLKVFGPRAQEVSMSVPRLIERINASYGYRAIDSIKITQVGANPNASAGPTRQPLRRRKPEAGELNRVESSIGDIKDEQLRRMLLELGRSLLGRPA